MADGAALGAGTFDGGRGPVARVEELDAAAEHFGDRSGHVVHSPAAQDELGEPVVDVGGALDGGAAVADDRVGRLEVGQRGAGSREEVGGVDGHGRVRGEGPQQGDLLPVEDAETPVGGEENADDAAAQLQGDAQDRDEPLVAHARVDDRGVLEAGIVQVAVGGVRPCRLRDESAEPLPHTQPQCLEARRDRAFGDPHIGVSGDRVVKGEIRGIGAQQRTGAPHDGPEHRVDVAQPRQVVRGGEERRQLGFAPSAVLQLGPDT